MFYVGHDSKGANFHHGDTEARRKTGRKSKTLKHRGTEEAEDVEQGKTHGLTRMSGVVRELRCCRKHKVPQSYSHAGKRVCSLTDFGMTLCLIMSRLPVVFEATHK